MNILIPLISKIFFQNAPPCQGRLGVVAWCVLGGAYVLALLGLYEYLSSLEGSAYAFFALSLILLGTACVMLVVKKMEKRKHATVLTKMNDTLEETLKPLTHGPIPLAAILVGTLALTYFLRPKK